MNQPILRLKRARKSAPKSRQGCITCKSRHVKCDEARPFCRRCAKAGRTCQGYSQDGDESPEEASNAISTTSKLYTGRTSSNTSSKQLTNITSISSASTNSPLPDPSGLPVRLTTSNASELRYLEYFYKRTAPAISGYFDAKFYGQVLLQAGQFEPAIRHGMMAAGAMHEHFEYALVPSFSQPSNSDTLLNDGKPAFALHQYNKAIAAINQQLSSGPGSIESVLMCCLLFVCLECLRGDTASAVSHLKAGGNIIANWKLRNQKMGPQSGSAYSSIQEIPNLTDSSFVNEHLVPIFERLSCHVDGAARIASSEYQDLVNPNINSERQVSEGFKDLDEARSTIMNLGSVGTRFLKGLALSKYMQSPNDDDSRVIAGLRRKFAQWDASMESLFLRCPAERGTRRATVLKVQHRLFQVAVATGLTVDQSANDCLTEDYEYILNESERLIGDADQRLPASASEEDISIFSLEEGVAPACFFVASRCRVPHVRRKAIELLRKGPARQGIWNAVLLARVAERLVDLEENFSPTVVPLDSTLVQQPLIDPFLDPNVDPNVDPTLIGLPLTPESLSPPMPGECTVLDHFDQADLPLAFDVPQEDRLPSESARIHHADIKESVDGTPHRHAVTFYRKPNGVDGDWDIWTEEIFL